MMMRVRVFGSSAGIVLAAWSQALAADLPANAPVKAPVHTAVYHWTGQSKMFPARLHALMQQELKRRDVKAPDRLWNQTGV